MRIKLKEGKQRELILLAKKDKNWKDLSVKLGVSEGYLCRDLKLENRCLSREIYKSLCNLSNVYFEKHVIRRLPDNWGRAKGGVKSSKNEKHFIMPKKDNNLAEIFGIILGDGHVSEYKKGKKVRVYSIRIAGNLLTDRDYIFRYIPKLFKEVFKEEGSTLKTKKGNSGYFTVYGKNLVEFIKSNGIRSGNKKLNRQGIPDWIMKNSEFKKRCLKGLIDTDGSIHLISKKNKNLRIDFTSCIPRLLNDAREAFISLGFAPSKVINKKHFFLSKKDEVEKYVKKIGFSNSKNLKRYLDFKKD